MKKCSPIKIRKSFHEREICFEQLTPIDGDRIENINGEGCNWIIFPQPEVRAREQNQTLKVVPMESLDCFSVQ
ncbi:unnamed protein product [Prunus armeniaca]|uniref:Uncharacterized protein n=1 Tax=Prunus armeniaca TaxID=36596 RepID=A0A6J5XGJ4_PRUAR|nr:hypothetical protein GBA52_021880 [Prunus armeniaca]CAB4281774.1 unnamed protein product [Prunus armeniaca]CAB4312081.1 unnamed protein product [Prunus armeniaca]